MASSELLGKIAAAELRITGRRYCRACSTSRPVDQFRGSEKPPRCDHCRAKAAERRKAQP